MTMMKRSLFILILALGLAGTTRAQAQQSWADRVLLSGNADVIYWHGLKRSKAPDGQFSVENSRWFLDIDLSPSPDKLSPLFFRRASIFFEWDLVREGELKNKVGSLYLRLDELFATEVVNLKLGRMPIPFGEEYSRFDVDRYNNPLLSYSASAAYNWDEGIMLFGQAGGDLFSYKLAVMNGDNGFGLNSSADPQVAIKLGLRPITWLSIALSGLRTGRHGGEGSPAKTALEFGGTHFIPFGSGSDVPNWQDGDEIEDDPNVALKDVWMWEGDLIFEHDDVGRLWLGYGQVAIFPDGDSRYERLLHYWIAEAVVELGVLTSLLKRMQLVGRYSAIGTLDANKGYSLEAMNGGAELGFNTRMVQVVSAGLTVLLTDNMKFKAEYSQYRFMTVDGATAEVTALGNERSYFGSGLSVQW